MTGGAWRLPQGGLVDRARPLNFSFNGARYQGLEGDTLASALLANGVHLVGRSFKLHRPRGIFGAGFDETGAIVQLVGDEDAPNALATRVALREGLAARSVNCWPGPRFDLGALAQLAAPLLPAGFYYKTFMWPDWHLFEPLIRKAAGLGRAPRTAPPDSAFESRFGHADIVVVGAGPAGLAAALSASVSAAQVILVDDGDRPGGRLLADGRRLGDRAGTEWAESARADLAARGNVRVLQNATAWGYLEHNYLAVLERRPAVSGIMQRNWKIRARQIVLATGAFERPIPFPGSDRPGIMLASAARTYVNRFAVRLGRRAAVFTNNDEAYAAAADLARSGIEIVIVDARAAPSETAKALLRNGAEVLPGAIIREARGSHRVREIVVEERATGVRRTLSCDLVCLSGGWNPAIHLASQSREARVVWDERLATFIAHAETQRFRLAGAAAGIFDLAGCLRSGAAAGVSAAHSTGFSATPPVLPESDAEAGPGIEKLWFVPPERRSQKVVVDLINDVTLDDLKLAQREGYESIEHLKRYTTAGMGIDQGKTGNFTVIGALAALRGQSPAEIGTTTFRQPYVPVEFGALAGHRNGHRLAPIRRSPITPWNVAAGAIMFEAGLRWQRPSCYPVAGESSAAAIERECHAVREAAGMYDGSPLGKLLVKGPDALSFLELVYANDCADLAPGTGRYGVMLSDDGLVLDDGVLFRLDETHFLINTSTGNAERVLSHLEQLLQLHYRGLVAFVLPVGSQWTNVTICGPRAREVLQSAGTDIALDRADFPFMTCRDGHVAGFPARVYRVSWTGELSFEVNTRSRDGLALWERLFAAGKPFGIAPVGSDASHVLRVEAGYISLGHEADGCVDARDLGLGWLISKKKPDFIGKRAMEIRRSHVSERRELVGLMPDDPLAEIPEGCPITPEGRRSDSEGIVSACVPSVVQRRAVALGMLTRGRQRHGETVHARAKDKVYRMSVVPPVFHDPDRRRVKS